MDKKIENIDDIEKSNNAPTLEEIEVKDVVEDATIDIKENEATDVKEQLRFVDDEIVPEIIRDDALPDDSSHVEEKKEFIAPEGQMQIFDAENKKAVIKILKKKEKKPKFANINEDSIEDIGPGGIKDAEIETTAEQEEKEEKKARKVTVSKGLSFDEVEDRINAGLVNITTTSNSKTIKQIILTNIFTIFNILNIVVAAALIAVGSWKNLLFMVIIIINTTIGIIQEIKAKQTIDSLSLVAAPTVTVIRDGKKEFIKSDEVVVDDIILYDAGKQIVADSIVRKGIVEVNESMLTGEADSIVKKTGSLLYSGSYVVSGECYAKVERVGDKNYINQLANQAKVYKRPNSEILRALQQLIKIITVVVIISGAILFTNSYLRIGADIKTSISSTAGSIIGMIPSGLYLMTSISLAYGVIKLGQKNTLVQDLYCIEMLARIDVLCLDKTGTITDGTMRVKDVVEYSSNDMSLRQIVSLVLGNTKESNATAEALKKKFGMVKKSTTKAIVPFSSVRKYMAAYFDSEKKSYIIGAPEFVMGNNYKDSNIALEVEKYAKHGLRVILVASSDTKITSTDQSFNDAKPLGLITIEDVIRKDAPETIEYFKNSNVNIKVISGDNPLTVAKIAMRAGVENASRYISLDGMSDDMVAKIAEHYTVFGRVSPKQKQILIRSLKEKKHTVAMTGDGVNDILALKEADCSIAMANGSEAARNVSHMVLLDSNFSSMPTVVKEGRRVINNIQRVATMFLTKTIFSFLLTMLCVIIGNIYPIQTIQLLLFDWFVVSIPSFYLALEPNNTQIKGKFLIDVFLSALPGSLLIVFDYGIIAIVSSIAPISNAIISTVTIISILCVGFTVLARVCRPFNMNRRMMYCLMLFLTVVFFFSIGSAFLELTAVKDMGVVGVLLAIAICQFSYPTYNLMVKGGALIGKITNQNKFI